jgi:hypothetical protein
MENEIKKVEARRVKASIREAIRKLTDDKGADCAADAPPGGDKRNVPDLAASDTDAQRT